MPGQQRKLVTMIYLENTATAIAAVNVKSLARSSVPKYVKAQIAASIASGDAKPDNFSKKQAAHLCGVSPSYVTIMGRRRQRKIGNGHRRHPSLTDLLVMATPSERAEAARAIGREAVWADMIEPLT